MSSNDSAFQSRILKIRELIDKKGFNSIVLRRNPNLAWAIGGRVHVPLTLDLACFDLVVTKNEVFAVSNAIEAPRLIAEEFPKGVEVKVINWWEGRDSLLPTGESVGSDQSGAGRIDVANEIERLRQSLIKEDIDRFKLICQDSAIALGEAIKVCESSDREIDVTARIAASLWNRNLELVFIGVAGHDRARNFRHPLPTESVVGKRIVASICARRKGLIASVTRIVSFADDDRSRYENLLKVEAAMFDATKVNAMFSEPLEAAIKAYPDFGFAENEWQKHHQGGPTGYAPRDWPANRQSVQLILPNQPIAWNPTGEGWKVEDTILATEHGLEILSIDPAWPTLDIAGRRRPALLVK